MSQKKRSKRETTQFQEKKEYNAILPVFASNGDQWTRGDVTDQ